MKISNVITDRMDKDSKIYKILETYWGDLLVIMTMSSIVFLYIIDGIIRGDFFHVDNFTIALVAYQLALLAGLLLTLTNFRLPVSRLALYAITILLAIIFTVFWEGLFGGDITLGVIDGARTLFYGGNPYDPNNPCCTHGLDEFQHLAPYPYLPVDVLFYASTLGILHVLSSVVFGYQLPDFAPTFNVTGFIVVNVILMALTMLVVYKTFPEAKFESLMLGFLVIVTFIWNNVTFSS